MIKERNYSIDILRLICSFMVISLHFPFQGFWGDVFKNISRAAVPIFFIISGYYGFDRNKEKYRAKLLKRIKHLAMICIGSVIFYFIYNIIYIYISGESVNNFILQYKNIKNVLYLILLNKSILCTPLWFLYALLYVTIFMYILSKYKIINKVQIFIPLLLAANLIFGCYSKFIMGKVFLPEIVRNWVLTGMPYYLIGIYINSKNIKNEKYISNILLISIILVLCVSTVLETMVLTKFNKISYFENFVSTIFLSVFVMIFAIQNPGKNSLISKLGRECAVYIYILQMAIGGVLKVLYPSCTISTILIFVIGILISIIYIKIKSITLKLRREKK